MLTPDTTIQIRFNTFVSTSILTHIRRYEKSYINLLIINYQFNNITTLICVSCYLSILQRGNLWIKWCADNFIILGVRWRPCPWSDVESGQTFSVCDGVILPRLKGHTIYWPLQNPVTWGKRNVAEENADSEIQYAWLQKKSIPCEPFKGFLAILIKTQERLTKHSAFIFKGPHHDLTDFEEIQ